MRRGSVPSEGRDGEILRPVRGTEDLPVGRTGSAQQPFILDAGDHIGKNLVAELRPDAGSILLAACSQDN